MNRPASNICAFGRGVLEKFKTNFDQQLSKDEGWDPYHGLSINHKIEVDAYSMAI